MSQRPLPPNRRLPANANKKAKVVEAPDEQTSFDDLPSAGDGRTLQRLRTLAGILFAFAISITCVWGLVHYTHTSPRFGVQTIDTRGTVHLLSEDVARIGEIHISDNIFALDLEGARKKLLAHPFIESVSITRRLPGAIRIDIVEREPAALVAMGGGLYLTTREGEIFKKAEPTDFFDLPIVTGIASDRVATDREGVARRIARGLDIASEYERLSVAKRHGIQEIHIPEDGTLSLVVGKEGLMLRMGKGPYRQALEQASRVLAEITSRRARPSIIFLDNEAHPERVVVRMK